MEAHEGKALAFVCVGQTAGGTIKLPWGRITWMFGTQLQ